jgi:Uma2 family endonuclease
MPTLLTPAAPPAPLAPRRKRWTRAECEALEALHIFDQQHVELVEGELIDKMGKNQPHVVSLVCIVAWLQQVFGWRFVSYEGTIDVAPEDNPTSEPIPDAIVLGRDLSHFQSGHPCRGDLRLVVEVSDSSLLFDLSVKAGLYARARIVEYWVLDVTGRRLIVHRNPVAGQYESVVGYGEQETIAPLAAPHAELRVAEAFA